MWPSADLRWDDSQVLDGARGDGPEVGDLHSGLKAQVNEEDLHHSASEGADDLEKNGQRGSSSM